jgi:hypothetical protein
MLVNAMAKRSEVLGPLWIVAKKVGHSTSTRADHDRTGGISRAAKWTIESRTWIRFKPGDHRCNHSWWRD